MTARGVPAQRQAFSILAAVLGIPGTGMVGGRHAPNAEQTELAGRPATLITPASPPPWPAFLFANGTTPDGRAHPVLLRLGLALARSGYAFCIPDLPGVPSGELTPAALSAAVDCTIELADDPRTRRGRPGLVGVSVGGALALLVAADQKLAPRISVVVCIAPFSDLEKVILLATTGTYRGERGDEPYPVPGSLSLGLGRSLMALLPPDVSEGGPDRKQRDLEHAGLSLEPGLLQGASDPAGAAVGALLANRDPERFDSLFEELPRSIRRAVAALSPVHSVSQLLAPVEIAAAPRDRYFPAAECYALAARNSNVRVTVTSALGHAVPRLDLANLGGLRRFDQLLVRSLRAAWC
jgi:pimeloyl-ACP methyl ester carboxylesterase